jgi:hypothetical protein
MVPDVAIQSPDRLRNQTSHATPTSPSTLSPSSPSWVSANKPRRARLIHRPRRTTQLLKKRDRYQRRRPTQPLDVQLPRSADQGPPRPSAPDAHRNPPEPYPATWSAPPIAGVSATGPPRRPVPAHLCAGCRPILPKPPNDRQSIGSKTRPRPGRSYGQRPARGRVE